MKTLQEYIAWAANRKFHKIMGGGEFRMDYSIAGFIFGVDADKIDTMVDDEFHEIREAWRNYYQNKHSQK